ARRPPVPSSTCASPSKAPPRPPPSPPSARSTSQQSSTLSLLPHMRAWFVLALAVLAGCSKHAPPMGPTFTVVDDAISMQRNVDILLMIDNSPGPSPKINETINRFPQLVKRLDQFATAGLTASYHIGVVDSDMGAGPVTLNQGQCHPDGDGGVLRTTA